MNLFPLFPLFSFLCVLCALCALCVSNFLRAPNFLRVFCFLCVLCALCGESFALDADPLAPWRAPDDRTYVVREVRAYSDDIFSHREDQNVLYRVADLVHRKTRENVILRESLLQPGDVYDPERAAETERNLRGLRFLAEARVRPTFHDDGSVDLEIHTRDAWTLGIEASAGLVGGVVKGRAGVSEENIGGYGKTGRLTVVRRDDGRKIDRLQYDDPQLLGSRWIFGTRLARGDLGRQSDVLFERPFRSREDPWSGFVGVFNEASEEEYYQSGEKVYAIPQRLADVSAGYSRAWGPRQARRVLGLEAGWMDRDFGAPVGTAPAGLALPVDRHAFTLSVTSAVDSFPVYLKRTGLNALDYVEDVPVGWQASGGVGLSFRRLGEAAVDHPVPVSAGGRVVWTRGEHLGALVLDGGARLRGGRAAAYAAGGFYHHYYTGLRGQTWALNVAADRVYEAEGSVSLFTLGEDSGLRGYPARQYSGDRRVRINLEDRVGTPFEWLSCHLGLVFFADAGLAWGPGSGARPRDFKRSVGLGLRLGSAAWLGSGVARIDVAFALDRDGGGVSSVSLSVARGQVFSLFYNEEELAERF